MKNKDQRKKLVEYLNYKDILIILGSWYLSSIVLLITKELNLNHTIITNLFHFLFIISGRFIYFSLMTFYLTSFYPIEFKDLGINFGHLKNQIKYSLPKIILLFIMVISIINIPVSFMPDKNFHPLFEIHGPDSLVTSLLPFTLLFLACLFISLSEQFILNVIIYELFNYTFFNCFFSLILTSLLYSLIIVELTPARILINTLAALISILIYRKKNSIIPSTLFMAGYYSIYIIYIYGFSFIKF